MNWLVIAWLGICFCHVLVNSQKLECTKSLEKVISEVLKFECTVGESYKGNLTAELNSTTGTNIGYGWQVMAEDNRTRFTQTREKGTVKFELSRPLECADELTWIAVIVKDDGETTSIGLNRTTKDTFTLSEENQGKDITLPSCLKPNNYKKYESNWTRKDGFKMEPRDEFVVDQSSGGCLTIVNLDFNKDLGSYTCTTTSVSDSPVSYRLQVIPKLDKMKNAREWEGDSFKQNCFIKQGFPFTNNVTWSKLNEESNQFEVLVEDERISFKSSGAGYNKAEGAELIIDNLVRGDRGNYSCSIENGAGKASQYLFLRVKDKLANIYPLVGLIIEIIILAIIIIACEKHRLSKKRDAAAEELRNNPTSKSPDDIDTAAQNPRMSSGDARNRKV